MKLAIFETKDWERDYLKECLPDDSPTFEGEALSNAHLPGLREVECISVFIYSRVTAGAMEQMPALRMIATRSTGFDHIDLACCRERGIVVSNVPTYGENTVAEHTFALILMLSRRVHKSYQQVREGRVELAMLTGFDLQGKTIGVVGAGRIGLHVIRIARGFGMRVLAYDVHRDPLLADLLGYQYMPMDDLLAGADIVSLHCPLTEATHHLIGAVQMRRMRRGALLINTARGGLVDTDALVQALDSGHLGGAGLDVIEGEELIREEKELLHERHDVEKLRAALRTRLLLGQDDVVFTPHNAFNSHEALRRILDTTVENLLAYRAGQPVNRVA
jgi:D-lactate dehydrogenase